MAPLNSPKPSYPKKPKQASLIWVLFLFVAVWFAVVYASIFAKTTRSAHILTVNKGDTYQSVFVKKPWQTTPLSVEWASRLYLKLYAKKPLHAGIYRIPQGASLADALKIVQQGADMSMIKIQIIEGKTIKDLYQMLKTTPGVTLNVLSPAKSDYSWADVQQDDELVANALQLPLESGGLEGQFAPNTYFFAQGVSDHTILQKLYDEQKDVLERAWQNRANNLPYKNPYEALIMASIVEKETGLATERAQVAAVFVNRLRQNMRLQTDPTIIYGLFDRYDGKIYRSNIQEKTAYNTYQIDGLPPTPIALPSADAIEAVMHPSDVPYLYFVATGKGGHKFSVTLDEHNKAVAQYRQVLANR